MLALDSGFGAIFVAVAVAEASDAVGASVDVALPGVAEALLSNRMPFEVATDRGTRVAGDATGSRTEEGRNESASTVSGWSNGRETARRVFSLLLLDEEEVGTSNETSEFSVSHEALFILNNAMMVTVSRVTLNLLDIWSTFDRSLPMVAFMRVAPLTTSAVAQLESPGIVHCEPVNPLEQTQEHWVPLDTLMPPFWQGLALVQAAVLLLSPLLSFW